MVNQLNLVIFTRYPEAGRTKTRMIPALGPQGAVSLHRELTLHTLHTARQLVLQLNCTIHIHFHGGNRARMAEWLGADLTYQPQSPGDLGAKMHHSFAQTLGDRGNPTIIIGTDCPSLTTTHLIRGFEQLQHHDLVLGPAWDGGYYLIGLTRPQPQLFQAIAWGTSQVLTQTLAIAGLFNLSYTQLEPLPDIDRPPDLVIWERIKETLEDKI